MNREFGKMGLIKDVLLKIRVSRNHKALPKPYHLFCILLETSVLGISFC
jgi:hypothetical protein